jgi:hypothetical protein
MARLSDLFPSKWLTAADLDEKDMTVTVRSVQIETMQDGVDKPVLYFEETDKGLVCNKTNGKTIAALYGNDTDDWISQRISLYPTTVDFQGKQTEAIRVRPRAPRDKPKSSTAPAPATTRSTRPAPAAIAQPDDDDDQTDEDIPF